MKTKLIALAVFMISSMASAQAADIGKEQLPSPKNEEKSVRDVEDALRAANERLARLRTVYLEKHPLVIDQLRTIARLERMAEKERSRTNR
jgi:hypothetical protein